MRYRYLLLIVVAAFFGCQSNSSSSDTATTNAADTTTTAIQKSEPIQAQRSPDKVYVLKGNMNAKMPVLMWLAVHDSIIKGQVTYLKSKTPVPIELRGTISGDAGISLHEFQKNGNITGTFSGKMENEKFIGTWYAPTAEGKEFSFQLQPADTTLAGIDTSFTALQIAGKYAYQFGKDGPQGFLDIKETGKDLFSIEISCVTSAPAYNMADLTIDSVDFVNNSYIYTMPGSETCKFRISILKGFLVINYIDDKYDCGFGHNASVEGVFMKTE